jgi:hypothetical protein
MKVRSLSASLPNRHFAPSQGWYCFGKLVVCTFQEIMCLKIQNSNNAIHGCYIYGMADILHSTSHLQPPFAAAKHALMPYHPPRRPPTKQPHLDRHPHTSEMQGPHKHHRRPHTGPKRKKQAANNKHRRGPPKNSQFAVNADGASRRASRYSNTTTLRGSCSIWIVEMLLVPVSYTIIS